jgi:hypothetical protein
MDPLEKLKKSLNETIKNVKQSEEEAKANIPLCFRDYMGNLVTDEFNIEYLMSVAKFSLLNSNIKSSLGPIYINIIGFGKALIGKPDSVKCEVLSDITDFLEEEGFIKIISESETNNHESGLTNLLFASDYGAVLIRFILTTDYFTVEYVVDSKDLHIKIEKASKDIVCNAL